MITFLSSFYRGRISDKELTKRSRLLSLLEPGDSVTVDRGFDIAELIPQGTHVNIHPFLEGREQLDLDELAETRRIAIVRIHVERAIERIKKLLYYKLFYSFSCSLG